MRPYVIAAAAALSAAACVVESPPLPEESSPAAVSQPIVNGEVDIFDRGVVALLRNGFSFCTGTLVSPRVVTTAAHCVDTVDDFQTLAVHVGERVGLGESIPVEMGLIHDQYAGSGSNDIAVLLLQRPAPARYWPTSTTAFDDDFVGRDTRIVGYGATDPAGGGDGQRREGLARITGFNELDFQYVSNPSQTCFGDSGGPAFLEIDGTEYLIGVTSRGDAECASFGIDTRVDVYSDWVQGFVALHDDPPSCAMDGMCAIDCDAPDPDCPCETDGFCDTGCEVLATDRDCPVNCDYDGVCQEDEGCPVTDRDCTPSAGVGEPCEFDTTCIEGSCIPAVDDERITYCSVACSGGGDCPGEMDCVDGMCRYEAPSPGAQGWPCAADAECFSERCLDDVCVDNCANNLDCIDGFSCRKDPEQAGALLCQPKDDGGCRAGGGGPGAWGWVLLAVLPLLRRRRRA